MSRLSRELREQRAPHPKPGNVVRGAKRAANREVLTEVARRLAEFNEQAAAADVHRYRGIDPLAAAARGEPPAVTHATIPACLRRIT